MNWETIILALIGGGIVSGIVALIQMFVKRKWDKDDKKENDDDKLDELIEQLNNQNIKLDKLAAEVAGLKSDVQHVKMAEQSILSDRIKWLGTKYLEAGEISFEDRRILRNLHNAYHNDCDGNGDFDDLMRAIGDLPLKMD